MTTSTLRVEKTTTHLSLVVLASGVTVKLNPTEKIDLVYQK